MRYLLLIYTVVTHQVTVYAEPHSGLHIDKDPVLVYSNSEVNYDKCHTHLMLAAPQNDVTF